MLVVHMLFSGFLVGFVEYTSVFAIFFMAEILYDATSLLSTF